MNFYVLIFVLKVQTVKAREEYIEEIKDLYEKGLSLFLTLVERISSLKGKLNFQVFNSKQAPGLFILYFLKQNR